jgi:hypothetical protein
MQKGLPSGSPKTMKSGSGGYSPQSSFRWCDGSAIVHGLPLTIDDLESRQQGARSIAVWCPDDQAWVRV